MVDESPVNMHNKFMAVIELVDGKYVAYCPEIPEAKVECPTKMESLATLRVKVIQILDERRGRAIDSASSEAVFESIVVD